VVPAPAGSFPEHVPGMCSLPIRGNRHLQQMTLQERIAAAELLGGGRDDECGGGWA